MSKILPQSFVCSLAEQGVVIPCTPSRQWLQKELQSLERCKKRRGFLALYDTALRYVALLLLAEGYSLVNEKAHVAFEKVAAHCCGHSPVSGKGVVAARHRLKYRGAAPADGHLMDLLGIVQALQQAWESAGALRRSSAIKC